MSEALYFGTKRIAERLKVGRRTILKWIRLEGMPVFRDSKKGPYLVLESSLCLWLKKFEKKYTVNK